MSDVTMPRLSDSMEEGTIVRWIKRDGDEVTRGEEIVEVETDKATMPYEADADGLLSIIAAEGETVAVGSLIARIGTGDGEPAVEPAVVAAAPAATQDLVEPAPPSRAPARTSDNSGGPTSRPPRAKASPLARRIAADLSVDLRALSGSGPGERIMKADVEGAYDQAAPSAPQPAPDLPQPTAEPAIQELSRLQRIIARRMSEAKTTVPEFTLTVTVDMEEAISARKELKALVGEASPAPSYNDLVIKACALALREHPRANGSYRDEGFLINERINVGMAVAGDDSLVVPVVADADHKGLAEIARETRSMAAAVRAGTIAPSQLDGATFTVSNLGMLGVDRFTAVIDLPQAAIVAVGSMTPQAAVQRGKVVVRNQVTLTLTCDHRILYGADAARFLADVRSRLENPLSMLL